MGVGSPHFHPPALNRLLPPADRESVSGEGASSNCPGRPVPAAFGNWSSSGTGEPPKGRGVRKERCRASWDGERAGRREECKGRRWKRR